MNTLKATTVTLVLALVMCAPALANPAVGTNPFLPSDGSAGNIYIPMQLSTSGILGDVRPDSKQVGLASDSVVLSGLGDLAGGWVDLELAFDITADRAPDFFPLLGGTFQLTFRDLDFLEAGTSAFSFSEWVEISYLLNPGDANSVGNTVRIDGSNYTNYIFNPDPSNPTPATNGRTLQYEIDMKGDLGLGDAELAELSQDNTFGLMLRFGTELEHLRVANNPVRNTSESISSNDFVLNVAPEPTTLVMLAMGSLALLRRRVG